MMSTNFYRASCIFILISTGIFLSGGALAGETHHIQTVRVIGNAEVYQDNIATARDRAIFNCLVSAVQKMVDESLPIESIVQNFEALNKILYDHTDKFVQDYKVLTEMRSEKSYRVIVEASVSTQSIQEQLALAGIMVGKKAMPRIFFLIVEQKVGVIYPQYWWGEDMALEKATAEIAMTATMKENGFLVIDREDKGQQLKHVALTCNPDFKDKEVAELGAALNADIVIVGKAHAAIAPNTMGEDIKSFRGTVTVRALRTDTAAAIASTEQAVVTANADEIMGSRDSLLDAGSLAGETLAHQIMTEWQKETVTSSKVRIILGGTRNLTHFVMFRKTLKTIPGVNEIIINKMMPDEAALTVDFEGNAQGLAEALMLKTFDTFGLNIFEVSGDGIRIELVSM
ncbi:hypothetical protein ACFL9U_01560 [Thermodesulfobacteriota bacterium]